MMLGDTLNEQRATPSRTEREQRALWLWLRALGADSHEADDLTQEALIIWARKGGQTWPGPQSGVFLRKTAANLLKATRRKEARREVILREKAAAPIYQRMLGDDPTPAQDALWECLETLPEDQRQAIELTYREGQSGAVVGRALGLEAAQVHQVLFQARQALRHCIEGKLAENE